MKTPKKKDIIQFLEGLVGKRFSEENLNKEVSEFFGEEIKVQNVSADREEVGDPDELSDFNLMFNVEREGHYELFADVYMLPMRREGFDGATMYITEVGYEFC